jgi:hypothetical protein
LPRAVRTHRVDVEHEIIRIPIADKGELKSIRRPGRGAIDRTVRSQAPEITSIRIDDIDLGVAIAIGYEG